MFFRVVNEKNFFFQNVSKNLEKKIIQSDLDFTDSQGKMDFSPSNRN